MDDFIVIKLHFTALQRNRLDHIFCLIFMLIAFLKILGIKPILRLMSDYKIAINWTKLILAGQ